MRAGLVLWLLLLGGLTACAGRQVSEPALDLLLEGGTLIDLRSGELRAAQSIAIRDGRIVALGDQADLAERPARQHVALHGRFLLPGLWDMHVHFGGGPALIEENHDLLALYVANGVSTVRDCAADLSDSVLQWRAQVASGQLTGPTIYTSGPKIEGINSIWPGDLEIGSEQELLQAFDHLQALKVDFVKLTDNTLKPELFLAGLAEARKRGLKTSAHVPYALTIDQVSSAGLGSIEHMGYALNAASKDEAVISAAYARGEIDGAEATRRLVASFDPDTARRNFALLAQRGTALTPTLNGSRIVAWLDQESHENDAGLAYIGPGLKATYDWRVQRAAKDDAAAIAARHARYLLSASLLPLLKQAGVRILAGTDAGFLNSYNYPGSGLHEELAELVKHGLTPLQALQAATLDNAAFLGQAGKSGELVVGAVADVLVLDENPLLDIRATQSIHALSLHGRWLDRAALDGLLEAVRLKVAVAKRGGSNQAIGATHE